MSGQPEEKINGYERRDTNPVKISLILLLSLALLVVIVVFLSNLFVTTTEQIITDAVLKPESVPLRELRAKEAEILSTYSIVDTEKRIYRIPIESAMQLQAEEASGRSQ